MCSTEANSVLKQHFPMNFSKFIWDMIIEEAEVHVPVLLAVIC